MGRRRWRWGREGNFHEDGATVSPGAAVPHFLSLSRAGDARFILRWTTAIPDLRRRIKVVLKEPSPHSSHPKKWETLSPHVLSKRHEDEPDALTFSGGSTTRSPATSLPHPLPKPAKRMARQSPLPAEGGSALQRRHAAGRAGDDLPRVGNHSSDHFSGSQCAAAVPARPRPHIHGSEQIGSGWGTLGGSGDIARLRTAGRPVKPD